MILKNLFLKKKIKMNTMKKKITRKKKYPPNKKHFIFFYKDSGIYGVFCICYRLI